MTASKVLLHIDDEYLRRETLDLLKKSGTRMPFEQSDGGWTGLLDRVARTKPDILLLDVSAVPAELNAAMRQIRQHAPKLKVAALNTSADPKVILAAMRAGANEFVHSPLEDHLIPALDRMATGTESEAVTPTRGKIIGFLSAKGGCGATTLACHVASELQKLTNKSVLIVDLDLSSGLVGFLMKTPSSYSILDPIKSLGRLDESLWKALTVDHRRGLSVIPAPATYSRWDHPDENRLRELLQFMRTQHEWVVLDLGRSLNSIAAALLDELDQLFLVSTVELVALHGLKTIVHGLFECGEKLQVVLNRTPKTMEISTQELEKILGRSLFAAVPNDQLGLYQSYSSGNLLDSSTRLTAHFNKLATKIAGIEPVRTKKKFPLFG